MQEQLKALEKELEQARTKLAASAGNDLVATATVEVKGIKVLAASIGDVDPKALRGMVDNLKDRLKPAVVLLAAGSADGKISLVGGVTADLTGRIKAGDLVGFVAGQVGGKGGAVPTWRWAAAPIWRLCRLPWPAYRSGSMSASDTGGLPSYQHEVDASGLTCPLPILRAKKALAQMESGQVLRVVTTDPNAIRDFQAFARQTGNTLLAQREAEGRGEHFLQRR